MTATQIKKSPLVKRVLRSNPHVYSAICRGRLFYSRSVIGAAQKRLYARNRSLLSMTEFEAKHCRELTDQGYTVLEAFFDTTLIDKIYRKADQFFKDCQVTTHPMYPGKYETLDGLTYEQLASSQKVIRLEQAMLQIPECVDILFHESILKIVVNFLEYIPSVYQGWVIRDFPFDRARESSNFHKDNDRADCLQIFVYLADINDRRGAQVYVPGSHRHDPKSCRPRLSRDLGIAGVDGRFTDEEIEKHYPSSSWAFMRPKRGSVGFISGNGLHKGPVWGVFGDPMNQPRTALRIDVQGHKVGRDMSKKSKIRRQDYERLSSLQKLFTNFLKEVD